MAALGKMAASQSKLSDTQANKYIPIYKYTYEHLSMSLSIIWAAGQQV